jgi:uncharacterized damage-inducible protein DinB
MRNILALAFLAVVASPIGAQTSNSASANPVVETMRREWQQVSGFITRAAEQMSESDYAFRPTPAVRSFGQLIAHLAAGQTIICGAALGQLPTITEDVYEKRTMTKAELTAVFKGSSEICARAYAQPDAAMTGPTKLFGNDATRLAALVRNTVHDGEHYGNIVTYMRIKGMVPPSSQPAPPAASGG